MMTGPTNTSSQRREAKLQRQGQAKSPSTRTNDLSVFSHFFHHISFPLIPDDPVPIADRLVYTLNQLTSCTSSRITNNG